ncbi:expressed unknown protein [Seminavis robusta]|uniref:SET domain-containing protein n=1 Tax=Seminavis robusta TaxID=568900 RepID=A0A9N8E605_9STRA|nr:expressed unknown protein [Seminavis robusta]|eukprot:Sro656_g182500.1 n/a (440) ;mRNA; r:48028-49347
MTVFSRNFIPVLSLVLLVAASGTLAFSASLHNRFAVGGIHTSSSSTTTRRSTTSLWAKAAKKKKTKTKNKSAAAPAGIKGFGGASTTTAASSSSSNVATDRSKPALAFYDYMEEQQHGAGGNLKRAALGYFGSLRGVVAMRDLKKGDAIIDIPYEMAINLGQEGGDPTLPALELLKDYCQQQQQQQPDNNNNPRKAYYDMLPPFRGDDSLGSTDFFSDAALEALQSPTVVDETLKRRQRCQMRFDQDIDESFPRWIDGTPVTSEHLQWAVWLITSRVLTVQGDSSEGKSYRLLIPFLDMCNHDRSSPHILSGRAVPGGSLKVVAGAPVKAGEQINIAYGGGVAGNDRFLQDYGFLDSDAKANDIVALQLLGKRRILEGAGAGRIMAEADREAALKLLRSTTMDQDRVLLEEAKEDPGLRSAIQFRLGVKQALSKQIVMQ